MKVFEHIVSILFPMFIVPNYADYCAATNLTSRSVTISDLSVTIAAAQTLDLLSQSGVTKTKINNSTDLPSLIQSGSIKITIGLGDCLICGTTAGQGNRLWLMTQTDLMNNNMTYVYLLRHTGAEMWRTLVFW